MLESGGGCTWRPTPLLTSPLEGGRDQKDGGGVDWAGEGRLGKGEWNWGGKQAGRQVLGRGAWIGEEGTGLGEMPAASAGVTEL